MYILAIETTGPLGSAAVIDEKGSVSLAVSAEEMNHLKDLMPMSRRLLQQLQIEPQDLTAVAASIGPGLLYGDPDRRGLRKSCCTGIVHSGYSRSFAGQL